MRPQYDRSRQLKAYHQHQEMINAHRQDERNKWAAHRSDTLGVEPDFPVEVLERQE